MLLLNIKLFIIKIILLIINFLKTYTIDFLNFFDTNIIKTCVAILLSSQILILTTTLTNTIINPILKKLSFSDKNFKTEVNTLVESEELFNYDSEKKYSDPFTLQELENTLDDLKIKSSTGPDDCPNKIFKNLGNTGKQIILNLANHSYLNNVILDEWKTAKIIMISKTPNDSHNINNYRPISLTNTIIKLLKD